MEYPGMTPKMLGYCSKDENPKHNFAITVFSKLYFAKYRLPKTRSYHLGIIQ